MQTTSVKLYSLEYSEAKTYLAAGTLCEWALAGSFHTAVQDFRIGLPGMLLQIFGGWAFINFIIRK